MTWGVYRHGLRDRLARLGQRLGMGVWEPGPVREVAIMAYTGKVFTAVVPTVEDRIVHRPTRNRITALRQADAYVAAGPSGEENAA